MGIVMVQPLVSPRTHPLKVIKIEYKEHATTECIKHLPNTNFWHYSLQLNTYKAMLEKNYNKKVTDLYLVRLHPNNTKKHMI